MAGEEEQTVAQLHEQIERNLAQLRELRQSIMTEVGSFVAEWYLERAGQVAEDRDEVTNRLGSARLAQLKADVRALALAAPRAAAEEYEAWPFWFEDSEEARKKTHPTALPGYELRDSESERGLDHPARFAMGRLGDLLDAAGYFANGSGDSLGFTRRNRKREAGMPLRDASFFYTRSVQWPPRLLEKATEYQRTRARHVGALAALEEFEFTSGKQRARVAWDNA